MISIRDKLLSAAESRFLKNYSYGPTHVYDSGNKQVITEYIKGQIKKLFNYRYDNLDYPTHDDSDIVVNCMCMIQQWLHISRNNIIGIDIKNENEVPAIISDMVIYDEYELDYDSNIDDIREGAGIFGIPHEDKLNDLINENIKKITNIYLNILPHYNTLDEKLRVEAGTAVVACGLKNATELNGKRGKVLAYDESTGTYVVQLQGNSHVRIHPNNCRLVVDAIESNVTEVNTTEDNATEGDATEDDTTESENNSELSEILSKNILKYCPRDSFNYHPHNSDIKKGYYDLTIENYKKNNKEINEKILFHGTLGKNIESILQNDFLLNINHSHGVVYGKGIYFTNDFNMSLSYTNTNPGERKYIVICKVIVGKIEMGNSRMLHPTKGYDTTVNDCSNPTIFVKYKNTEYNILGYVEIFQSRVERTIKSNPVQITKNNCQSSKKITVSFKNTYSKLPVPPWV